MYTILKNDEMGKAIYIDNNKKRLWRMRRGQVVYVVTAKGDVKQLMETLRGAKAEVQLPVKVAVSKADDGNLMVEVHNMSGRYLDIELNVNAPGLLGHKLQWADMKPENMYLHSMSWVTPPAPGTIVPVTVKLKVGMHGNGEGTFEVPVQY